MAAASGIANNCFVVLLSFSWWLQARNYADVSRWKNDYALSNWNERFND